MSTVQFSISATVQFSVSTYTYINSSWNIGGSSADVATKEWGKPWRMPTKEEAEELIKNCELSIDYDIDTGMYLCKFIGKNGNYIIFPCAGSKVFSVISDKNIIGTYWTTTTVKAYTYSLDFSPIDVENQAKINFLGLRYWGKTVRAVAE